MKNKLIFIAVFSFFISVASGGGEKILLTCSHFGHASTADYGFFTQETFDIKPEAERAIWLASWHGFKYARILPFNTQWHTPSNINKIVQPFKWDGSFFNLNKWDHRYWDSMKRLIKLYNLYGVTVWFSLFDVCGLHTNQQKRNFNPWFNNNTGKQHFLKLIPESRRFAKKALLEFKDLKVNYEICNELRWTGDMATLRKWAIEIMKVLKEEGIPPERISYGASVQLNISGIMPLEWMKHDAKEVFGEIGRQRVFRPVHGCGSNRSDFGAEYQFAVKAWGKHPISVTYSTDGAYLSEGVDGFLPGKYRPSPEILAAMLTELKAKYLPGGNNQMGFEIMPKLVYKQIYIDKLEAVMKVHKTNLAKKYKFCAIIPITWWMIARSK